MTQFLGNQCKHNMYLLRFVRVPVITLQHTRNLPRTFGAVARLRLGGRVEKVQSRNGPGNRGDGAQWARRRRGYQLISHLPWVSKATEEEIKSLSTH